MFVNDRRQHKRFLVTGQARFHDSSAKSPVLEAEVLNVSAGGLLIFSKAPPPLGTQLDIRFTIEGYNSEVSAKGKVVRHDPGAAGIGFLGEASGLSELLLWLEANLMSAYL